MSEGTHFASDVRRQAAVVVVEGMTIADVAVRIVSNWKREGKTLAMDITIPGNTATTVYLPGKDGDVRKVGPGHHPFNVEMEQRGKP